MTTTNNKNKNNQDAKSATTVKSDKPGAVSVAAQEAARLDRLIAEKRGDVEETKASSVPGAASAFEQVVMVQSKIAAVVTESVAESSGMMEKKVSAEDNSTLPNKVDEVAKEEAMMKKEEMATPVVAMEKDLGAAKENMAPEQAMPAPVVTADHGVVQEPDVEYGVYEPNEDGLAVAVAVTEDDDDVFIPSAVEYDPDAKPPLHRNRRFRLYGFLALFALVACAVGATVGIVLSGGSADVQVHPREELGIRELVENLVGQEKLTRYNSPYARALNWIIYEDPLEPKPEDVNFVQRYTLVYFAFAMGAVDDENKWRTCGPINVTADSSNEAGCTWDKLASVDPVIYVSEPRARWLSNAHECEWAGIRCDAAMQVRSLEFGGQGLAGPIPEGIQYLAFLQSLALPSNNITNTIPTEIGSMKHLVNLELALNELTGTIPDILYEMKSLVRLNLGHNQLQSTISTEVGSMRDLKSFFVQDNMLTGTIPSELGNLQSMTFLRMSENRLQGTFPSELGNLGALEEFWLADNNISGEIPSGFGNMINMVDIRMRRNPLLGGRFPDNIWNFKLLNWVDIRGCNFTGALGPGIGSMGDLVTLKLSNNPLFSGTIPKEIASAPYLGSFHIDRTDIDGPMPDEICQASNHLAFNDMVADCLGDSPQVECSCCFACCDKQGECKRME